MSSSSGDGLHTTDKTRATTEDISAHLVRLVGPEVPDVIRRTIQALETVDPAAALAELREIDEKLGPYSLYNHQPQYKYPGVYRPLSYVSFYLWQPHRDGLTRDIVDAACGFVETVLKRMVRTNVFDRVREVFSSRPMGGVIHQLVKEKHLQPDDADDLKWLTEKVYNFAKHEREVPPLEDGQEVDRYFSLEEALAIYLIARQLAWALYRYSGKPQAEFTAELAQSAR